MEGVGARWRRRISIALLAAMTLNFAATASAQAPRAGVPDSIGVVSTTRSPLMQPSAVWAPAPNSVPLQLGDTAAAKPETHWATGAIIGGAALGLFTGLLAARFCASEGTNENCGAPVLAGFLVGAAVGIGLGAFIGARFPKHPKNEPAPAEAAP